MSENRKRILLSGALLLGHLYLTANALLHPVNFPGLDEFLPYLGGFGVVLAIVLVSSIWGEVRK